jgi:hypothetical protein
VSLYRSVQKVQEARRRVVAGVITTERHFKSESHHTVHTITARFYVTIGDVRSHPKRFIYEAQSQSGAGVITVTCFSIGSIGPITWTKILEKPGPLVLVVCNGTDQLVKYSAAETY